VILVDTSVWIDYFRGTLSPQVEMLDALLAQQRILMGDLILTEILQGFRTDREFDLARESLAAFECVTLGGHEVAINAAQNFRKLRALGITVRKTIDTVIATKCIMAGYTLLHADRDFEPFAQHLGLREAYTHG